MIDHLDSRNVRLPPALRRQIRRWAELWGVQEPLAAVQFEWSARMQRSLGRSYPKRSLIRLNPHLILDSNRSLFREALCHELAHIAAYQLYGRVISIHGPEWRDLLRQAGFEPRTKVPVDELAHS